MARRKTSPAGSPSTPDDGASDTVSALLHAAAREVAERGYEGTRIHAIVKRAGLTTGAVYRQFKNKNALLKAAVIHKTTTRRLERFDPRRHANVAAFLREAGRLDYDLDGELGLLLEALVCARRVPEVAEAVAESQRVWVTSTQPLIDAGVRDGSIDPELDPEAIAMLFRVIGLGSMLYLSAGLKPPSPEAWDALLRRIIRALAPAARPDDPA